MQVRHEKKKKKGQMDLLKIHSHLQGQTWFNPTFTNMTFHFSFNVSLIFLWKEIRVQF